MHDCISRQAAIDEAFEVDTKEYGRIEVVGVDAIESLPPVNPQPNKENIHREREQAYMCGYEDGSRKYRTEQSEDAISREPFTDSTICEGISCNECSFNRKDKGGCILEERVMRLPSIQPQPKTGHWIEEETYVECPNCHDIWHYEKNQVERFKCCPTCGERIK